LPKKYWSQSGRKTNLPADGFSVEFRSRRHYKTTDAGRLAGDNEFPVMWLSGTVLAGGKTINDVAAELKEGM